jgi:hypothetical protein
LEWKPLPENVGFVVRLCENSRQEKVDLKIGKKRAVE